MWGKDIAKAMTFFIIVCCLISAVVGWGVIEGFIWLFSHISISFT